MESNSADFPDCVGRATRQSHCSQAEANDAATAQSAAQTPSADNRTSIQIASLVNAKTTAHPDLSHRDGRLRNMRLLTKQSCGNMKLRSTSSSLGVKSVLRTGGQ
jgi:hypothetical protein